MAAPRTLSFKALQNLQHGARSAPASTRSLHITGAFSSPARLDPGHTSALLPLGLQELRNECRKRALNPSGTKPELIDRLAAHDNLQARAFSMALRRISQDATKKTVSGPADTTIQRTFNTSRANKSVNDSSTIDFAYLPQLFSADFNPPPTPVRVPILPQTESDHAEAAVDRFPGIAAGGYQDTDAGVTVMKPEIQQVDPMTVSSASAMSDVHDGSHNEMSVDTISKLAETVSQSAKQFVETIQDKDESVLRRLWNGFLDDLLDKKEDPKAQGLSQQPRK